MNFWSAAEAGTISISEKCSDDGRRDDMGLAGMRRLLPKLISLLFFFWEFSANEVEFSARSAFFFWEFSANEVEFSARSAFFFWEFSANEVEFSARSAFFFWELSANDVEFSARSASRLGEEVKRPPLPDTALSSLRPLASSISCVGGAGS
jgi:hypothetical protein